MKRLVKAEGSKRLVMSSIPSSGVTMNEGEPCAGRIDELSISVMDGSSIFASIRRRLRREPSIPASLLSYLKDGMFQRISSVI